MADDSLEGVSGVRFRDDILRGVRLFAIVFALILVAVWVYRMIRAQSDVRGASPDVSAAPETAQPIVQIAPAPPPDSETHGLSVPPPPPAPGEHAPRIARPRVAAKPAGAVASTNRAPAPVGRDFESSQPSALRGAPVVKSLDADPVPAKTEVGYKSLLETNTNRVIVVVPQAQAPAQESSEKPAKGNRFLKGVGKILHAGSKKETMPLTLRDPKQP
jgi:hypothetical protein